MTSMTTTQHSPSTAAEYKAAFERLMAEAEGIHEQMGQDRTEIERLKVETKVIRDETRILLARLELETPAQ